MAELAAHLARRFGLAPPDVDAITEAAMLHDIGLYTMTPAYHAFPRPLSFEARLDLWRHPVIGEQQMAKRDAMRHAQLRVRWHHEWWNGSGYPDMLAFEDIPVARASCEPSNCMPRCFVIDPIARRWMSSKPSKR